MPFLLPALVALGADVLILWLNHVKRADSFATDEDNAMYHIHLLAPLAGIRLLILCLPLLFHSYTGTAIQCASCYPIFYAVSLGFVVIHMLALCLLRPTSLEAIFPTNSQMDHLHHLRIVWWILIASLLSIVSHAVMFWHVRSSAPSTYSRYYLWPTSTTTTRSSLPSLYYALRTGSMNNMMESSPSTSNASPITMMTPMTTPTSSSTVTTLPFQPQQSELEPDLMHAMNDWVVEIHGRLRRAKLEWTARLDDFTTRLHASHTLQSSEHMRSDTPSLTRQHSASLPQQQQHQNQLTPFRVMLLLFAYEDVLTNGKLDAMFDRDGGAALTFLVPQLLSFLLHGALYCSPQLEEWILQKCQTHFSFAHRCYWFLRAWCLQAPTTTADDSPADAAPTLNNHHTNGTNHHPIAANGNHTLDSNATTDKVPSNLYLDNPSSPARYFQNCGGRSQKSHFESPRKRFISEEREMIERLLLRVRECGQSAALQVSYGPALALDREDSVSLAEDSDHAESHHQRQYSCNNDNMAPGRSAQSPEEAASLGLVPVSPLNGQPSQKHFETLAADQRHGLLPRAVCEGAHSSLARAEFDGTIVFLDSLLRLADDLFLAPPEDRKTRLRTQLQQLECDLLPSNSIYMPLGQHKHRVWRIVASESIAISTKERVPCIVYLEVLDYGDGKRADDDKNTMKSPWNSLLLGDKEGRSEEISEAELVKAWRNERRNPHRRSRFLHKVQATVQSNVQVMQDHLQHYRERSFSEEMSYLKETLVPLHDVEAAATPERCLSDGDARMVSRTSSGASLVSMGQWSHPHHPDGEASFDLAEASPRRTSLQYGSNEEGGATAVSPLPSSELPKSGEKKRTPPVVFREDFHAKQERIRAASAFGSHPGWRLLPILVKSNDDLRQEQLASQLIYKMAAILAREKVGVWLCNYEILALSENGGIIEAIPDTISLDSLKKNDPNFTSLKDFFHSHFTDPDDLADAKANFVESLAAYSMVCFLLQIKDRHNGNILLTNRGHLVHIDFGFFFLSSPGKNAGFESAPFKLTRDFVEVLDGPNSFLFKTFRELCVKVFLALRRHCMELILLVEMLKTGNEQLKCFRGRPEQAIQEMRDRFRLDLNDRACREYVQSLVDDSIENWRTDWYDRYQRYFVGVL